MFLQLLRFGRHWRKRAPVEVKVHWGAAIKAEECVHVATGTWLWCKVNYGQSGVCGSVDRN